MLKQLKSLKPYVITYIGLILLYMVLLLAVYSIPNSMVEDNVKLSLDFLELEGTGPLYTFYTNAARTDNYSDAINVFTDASTTSVVLDGIKYNCACSGQSMTILNSLISYHSDIFFDATNSYGEIYALLI